MGMILDKDFIGKHTEKVDNWNPQDKLKDFTFNYIDLSSLDKHNKCIDLKLKGSEAPSRARQKTLKGDVLISTVRPNLNGVAIISDNYENGTASTGYCVLRTKSTLNNRYLYYWLRTNTFIKHISNLATGASYPAVSDKIIKDTKIPLPPLPVQRKIAEVLDAADRIRQRNREVLKKYDQLAQSVFLEMFGGQKSFILVPISEVASKDKYSLSSCPFGSNLTTTLLLSIC